MQITLNGEPRQIFGQQTIQDLLDELKIPAGRVACELNLKIVRRTQYATVSLKEGDEVEIIQAIGGG